MRVHVMGYCRGILNEANALLRKSSPPIKPPMEANEREWQLLPLRLFTIVGLAPLRRQSSGVRSA